MKKIFLVFAVSFMALALNAQSNLTVSLCGKTDNTVVKEKAIEKTVTLNNLLNCTDLVVNQKGWKIAEYYFSITTEDKTVMEIRGSQSKITERMTIIIKKYKPQKIWLEKFKLSNGEKEVTNVTPLVLIVNY